MATSLIRKTEPYTRLDGTQSGVGGGQIRIPLKKESLVAEHQVRMQVSQAYTGVPTGYDVRKFISKLSIETSDGRRVFLDGYQAYDLARFTEGAQRVDVALAATSTADFTIDIHHENDGALQDLMAAINAQPLTTFDLVIDLPADNANGFTGGTVPLVANYTVTARSKSYPDMLRDSKGNLLPIVGALRHVQESPANFVGASAGTNYDMRLISGNRTRFLMLHAYDTTGASPALSDSVIDKINLIINNEVRREYTWKELRRQNAMAGGRGFDVTGVCALDWEDDEAGFLNLEGVNEPKLQVVTASGAPAGYKVTLAQDYSIRMK